MCCDLSLLPACLPSLAGAVLPSAGQVALAVGVAAGVTGARLALLAVWPDFRDASERSNQQVGAAASAALWAVPQVWLDWGPEWQRKFMHYVKSAKSIVCRCITPPSMARPSFGVPACATSVLTHIST